MERITIVISVYCIISRAANVACPVWMAFTHKRRMGTTGKYVSDQRGPYQRDEYGWEEVGRHLKATGWLSYSDGDWHGNGLWYSDNSTVEGTNDFGFSGLPGGFSVDGLFYLINSRGTWWSATLPYHRVIQSQDIRFHTWGNSPNVGNSVRCLRD